MATTTEIITNSLAQKLFTPNTAPPLNFLHCCLFFEVTFWVAPVTDPENGGSSGGK